VARLALDGDGGNVSGGESGELCMASMIVHLMAWMGCTLPKMTAYEVATPTP